MNGARQSDGRQQAREEESDDIGKQVVEDDLETGEIPMN